MARLWGIRHVRYWWHLARFSWWWVRVGHYYGAVPNAADIEYLAGVWSGEH